MIKFYKRNNILYQVEESSNPNRVYGQEQIILNTFIPSNYATIMNVYRDYNLYDKSYFDKQIDGFKVEVQKHFVQYFKNMIEYIKKEKISNYEEMV